MGSERIPEELWNEIIQKLKPRNSPAEFKQRVQCGDIWSLKVAELKDIIKVLKNCFPRLSVTGTKGELIDRIQGVFSDATTNNAERNVPPPKVVINMRPKPTPQYHPYPAPCPAPQTIQQLKQEVDDVKVVVKSGRCLSHEEARGFQKLCSDLTLAGHQNPACPIEKVLDLLAVTGNCCVNFELDAQDHSNVIQRLLRVHLVPLKFNLEPEAWLQPDMHVFVNDAFIETMPKNWRKKNARVNTFMTVIPLDITAYISKGVPRCSVRLHFPNKDLVWHGLLAVFLVGSQSVSQLVLDVCNRPPLPVTAASAEDDEVQVELQEISLRCPLAFTRLKHPAKGIHCNHKACFDLEMYLQLCGQQRVWNCPICEQPCSFTMLRVDALLSKILAEVTDPEVQKVCLRPDNQWELPGAAGPHCATPSGLGTTEVCLDETGDDEAPTDTEYDTPPPSVVPKDVLARSAVLVPPGYAFACGLPFAPPGLLSMAFPLPFSQPGPQPSGPGRVTATPSTGSMDVIDVDDSE